MLQQQQQQHLAVCRLFLLHHLGIVRPWGYNSVPCHTHFSSVPSAWSARPGRGRNNTETETSDGETVWGSSIIIISSIGQHQHHLSLSYPRQRRRRRRPVFGVESGFCRQKVLCRCVAVFFFWENVIIKRPRTNPKPVSNRSFIVPLRFGS